MSTKMSSVKKTTITGVCVALCYILPLVFHSIGAGSLLSPMHIPVLLCGMVCGGAYGLICGVVGPLLSHVLSGMPGATMLITMIPELMAYGLTAGLFMKFVHTKKTVADVYISIIAAMILGRVVGGIASALYCVIMATEEAFTLAIWVSSYFVGTAPGIVCHLILVPLLVFTLMKAKLIPQRY